MSLSKSVQNRLVLQHGMLVKRIAASVKKKLPPQVDLDDLIQTGMIALLEAAEGYDDSMGAKFTTYVGIRVRGAILDEIRRNDWAPRSARRMERKIAAAVQSFEQRELRAPTDAEVAAEAGISMREYSRYQNQCSAYCAQPFTHTYPVNDDGELVDMADPSCGDMGDALDAERQAEERRETLSTTSLTDRERLAATLYFDEDLTMREIGEICCVSECRVSQIVGSFVAKSQSAMGVAA